MPNSMKGPHNGAPLGSFRPDLLVVARQSRGITQSQLSKITGLSQPMISRIEQQGIEPAPEQLALMADALGYPPAFFSQGDQIYGFGIGELFHRRRQSIAAKALERVHAELNVSRMMLNRLLVAIDSPPLNLPTFEDAEFRQRPRDAARALRARWLLPPGPVTSVTDVLERAGIILLPGEFSTDLVDAIGLWPIKSPPLIFFNPAVPQDRLRFTLLHEVAHLVLHSGWNLEAGPELEAEANAFAGEFLAPEREIRSQLRGLTMARLPGLKRHWRISMASLIVQAKDLNAIGPDDYQRLWRDMSRMGLRKREPPALDVAGETPGAAFFEILRIYREELHYTVEEIAQVVHRDAAEIQSRYFPKLKSDTPRLRLV